MCDAIVEKALELGLFTSEDRGRVRVYGASKLAAWASRYPGLAVSELIGGPGRVAIEHDAWSTLFPHHTVWVPDPARDDAIAAIREIVQGNGPSWTSHLWRPGHREVAASTLSRHLGTSHSHR